MSSGKRRSSRSTRILTDELDDDCKTPPILPRRKDTRGYDDVNPQEANTTTTTTTTTAVSTSNEIIDHTNTHESNNDGIDKNNKTATPKRTKNARHSKPPRSPSDASTPQRKGSATRSSSRSVISEEGIDEENNETKHSPKQSKKSKKKVSPSNEDDRINSDGIPSRTIASKRSFSSLDSSMGPIPSPLTLTFQETEPTSNVTTTRDTTIASVAGQDAIQSNTTTSNITSEQQEENHTSLLPRIDSTNVDDSTIASTVASARSTSVRTNSTNGTLDLVLAKRYAAYYGDDDVTAKESQDNIPRPTVAPQAPLETKDLKNGYTDSGTQFLLDEKRRQAGGYISRDMEQYTSAERQQQQWVNRNDHHTTIYDTDDGRSHTDTSSSTVAPEPPTLQLREHYMRPGAYRMRQGGEARHVDNDSVNSASLRTTRTVSTLRTNLGLGIIEASLVVDEPLPKDEDGVDVSGHQPKNGYRRSSNGHHNTDSNNYPYINAKNRNRSSDESDCEYPSPPTPISYAVSGGDATFLSISTGSPVVEAHPLDERHTIKAFFRKKKVRCMIGVLALFFIALAIGTVYAITGGIDGNQNVATDSDKGTGGSLTTSAPSSAPTSQGDLDLEYLANVALPGYTRAALSQPNSPQTQALQWLRNNTNLESYSLSRRLQRFALATLFLSTGGEQRWNKNFGWMTDQDECTWFSSEQTLPLCTDKNELRVLSLRFNGLRGTIAPELGLLSSLELLQMDENILSGFLPTTLGGLSQLNEIRLFDNYLSGIVPSQLGSLTSLETLDLAYNFLAQILPTTLGKLVNLKRLSLDRNTFVGRIPSEFGNMSKLTGLYLYNNLFTGTVPAELGTLSNLVNIEMDINNLSGNIPSEIGFWNKAQNLNFGNNTLTGSIPTEIGMMTQLTQIDIYFNNLEGELPSEIGLLSNLEGLYLEQNNGLAGRLPVTTGSLGSLKELWLYSNGFVGSIPTTIGQLSQLVDINLSINQFGGNVPTEIGKLSDLAFLDISFNNFTGPIPSELGRLTNVKSIRLNDNQFTGTMPIEICNLVYEFGLIPQNLTVDCGMVVCTCCDC